MCRALLRWEIARQDDQLPLHGALDLHDDADLAPHYYLVQLAPDISASLILHCGAVLGGLCDGDPQGKPVGKALPPGVRGRMADFFHSAALYRQVLADSDSFLSLGGEVLYRNIVMPMQGGDGAVTSIVGAFSYRIQP